MVSGWVGGASKTANMVGEWWGFAHKNSRFYDSQLDASKAARLQGCWRAALVPTRA